MTLQTIRITARSGAVYGHRVSSRSGIVDTESPINLDLLASAVDLISSTPRNERVIVPVAPCTLDEHLDAYLSMLSTVTPAQASRLVVELYDPVGDADLTAAYRLAKFVQQRMHMCVAAWANPAHQNRLVTTLKHASPNLLFIHHSAAKADIANGTRAEVLDILEAAQESGCVAVVDGVETLEHRTWYHEIGVRLFACGLPPLPGLALDRNASPQPSVALPVLQTA
ncbi:hypothetical protein [Ottowia sp.]|uniref:hypothetical protein n=1 Tax=Ottowia sp. TaxID=1898956 RepID=UPI0025D47C37|nr:hypothetical protein [Ottowia sp.]MBK6616113.1 hypothetical protein [Ottowia sp.]